MLNFQYAYADIINAHDVNGTFFIDKLQIVKKVYWKFPVTLSEFIIPTILESQEEFNIHQ